MRKRDREKAEKGKKGKEDRRKQQRGRKDLFRKPQLEKERRTRKKGCLSNEHSKVRGCGRNRV
jgi:hypothetical protein